MKSYYAMIVQRALVAGQPTGSIDVSAFYFLAESEDDVRSRIQSRQPLSYEGAEGDAVTWELLKIMSVEECSKLTPGDEVTGFITSIDELGKLDETSAE